MPYFDSKWVETFQGMRGRWKTYFPIYKDGEYRPSFRIFHPLAAGECPHDNYIIESVSVSDAGYYRDGNRKIQYITAFVYCETCETNGEISFSTDRKTLEKDFHYIYWNAQRQGVVIVWDDAGFPTLKAVMY